MKILKNLLSLRYLFINWSDSHNFKLLFNFLFYKYKSLKYLYPPIRSNKNGKIFGIVSLFISLIIIYFLISFIKGIKDFAK